MTWDVIISGGGIIGVSLALELRRRGSKVLVLDRGEPGKEASSAAAGMLAATDPETPEKLRGLAEESARMYPAYVERLENASGIKVDFHQGAWHLLPSRDSLANHKPLSPAALKQLAPCLDACGYSAHFLPHEHSVDPGLLMQAALRAAQVAGVEVRGHAEVQQIASRGGQVEVVAAGNHFFAQAAVNCQGTWAGTPVRPRKGQMIYLQPQRAGLLRHVLRTPEVYLVPRSSGKILAGATVEDVGYDKSVDPEIVRRLHHAAARFVPELSSAQVAASWAGLRPGTPDDLPILDRTEAPGVFIAAGHFRNGILLAPITATIMADLIEGKKPAMDVSAFSYSRFSPVSVKG